MGKTTALAIVFVGTLFLFAAGVGVAEGLTGLPLTEWLWWGIGTVVVLGLAAAYLMALGRLLFGWFK